MAMRLKTIRPDFRFLCFLNKKIKPFSISLSLTLKVLLLNERITKTLPGNFAILPPLFAKDAKEFFFLSYGCKTVSPPDLSVRVYFNLFA